MFDGKESIEFTDIFTADRIICVVGLLLLARWLLATSLGRKAFADSPSRRNNMPLYVPLIPLIIWFGPVPMASMIAQKLFPGLQPWQDAFLDNCVYSIGALVTVVVILLLARTYFARRLKGFGLGTRGLNVKTIAGDFAAAFMNLLAVWPLVMAAMILTINFMELISGQEYQMERHQELNLIVEYPQLPLQILIAVVAILVAPVLEEMLFRGLVQTTLRSLFEMRYSINVNPESDIKHPELRIWLAIVVSSAFFALMHANAGHWPALFVLGICMGYAYEKSGSLLRPIFIHALFNATTILATLSQ
jgi:membrane protease YdiL (CAAX protease family)